VTITATIFLFYSTGLTNFTDIFYFAFVFFGFGPTGSIFVCVNGFCVALVLFVD
jgi:hypothetical protein